MALQTDDLFIVQKQGGAFAKLTAEQLTTYVTTTSGSVNYRGACDLTLAPTGQLDPDPPVNGDMYINNVAGVSNAGWLGIAGSTPVSENDRVIYDGAQWELIPTGGDSGVLSIQGAQPIFITGDAEKPTINSRVATTDTDPALSTGHVQRLATENDTKFDGTGDANAVVTADLLKAANIEINNKIENSNITGADPIVIDNASTAGTSEVQIKDGTSAQKGAVRLSTDAEAADTGEDSVALTPKGAHEAFLVKDFSTYTAVDPGLLTDIVAIYRPGTGNRQLTIQEIIDLAPVQSVNGEVGDVSLSINSLTDVDTTTSAPGLSAALIWDGSNWVPGAAGSGGAVNLGYIPAADKGTVSNDSGANAEIPLATTTEAGLLAPGQFDKIEGLPATGTPNLQQVTDIGATTTADVTVNDLTTNDITANIVSAASVASTGNITAGTGDNQILLTAATGEITGGANVFIDCGEY